MKNLLFFACVATILLTFVLSCNENEVQQKQLNEKPEISKAQEDPNPVIYYGTWDEWGRASLNCLGWGLCNYEDCWFCCIDAVGQIVDCDTGLPIQNSGTISIDAGATQGIMTIKLNTSDYEQNQAITNQSTLYIDDDIVGVLFTLNEGDYVFDSNIGSHGGYTVDVTMN